MGFRRGAAVQMASKYASVAANMLVTMVLARVLTPSEYGVMSVVTVFLGLFQVMSNAGVNAAVIQYRDLTEDDLSRLLTFTFVLGLGMAAVFCLLSVPISVAYGDWAYVPLMCASSLSVVFRSVDMVPDGVQIRNRQFGVNGLRTIVSTVASGVVAVLLALAGWGVWALVANNVLQSLIIMAWNLAASGLRLGPPDFLGPLRRVLRFSVYQLASQVAQYLVRNLDNLLVGLVMGSSALGLYDKAYKLSKYPIDYIPSTVNPVLKSWFSTKQGDADSLWAAFLRVQRALAAAGFGIGVICVFAGRELILLLFGSQWAESVAPFQLLAISIPFQLVNFTSFTALEGLKRTDLLWRNVAMNCAIIVACLAVGLTVGSIEAVAALVSLAFALATPTFLWYVVRRGFGRPIAGYVRQLLPALVAACLAAAVLALTNTLMPQNIVASLLGKVVLGGGVYLVALWVLGGLRGLAR